MFEYANCEKCGYAVMIPVKLDQFELRAVIGSGGMATVYRAHDEILNRDVAVKCLPSYASRHVRSITILVPSGITQFSERKPHHAKERQRQQHRAHVHPALG